MSNSDTNPFFRKTRYTKLDDFFISFIGVKTIKPLGVSNFISMIQELQSHKVAVQAIKARAMYGIDHLLGVLKIILESQNRKIVSYKSEIELLLRLSLTNQINFAIQHAGLSSHEPGVIIIFSKDRKKVTNITRKVLKTIPHIDASVLNPDTQNRDYIFQLIPADKRNHLLQRSTCFIIRYLVERSALVTLNGTKLSQFDH